MEKYQTEVLTVRTELEKVGIISEAKLVNNTQDSLIITPF